MRKSCEIWAKRLLCFELHAAFQKLQRGAVALQSSASWSDQLQQHNLRARTVSEANAVESHSMQHADARILSQMQNVLT